MGKRRHYRQKVVAVLLILLLNGLAFYAFQSIARVKQYQEITAIASMQDSYNLQATILEEQHDFANQLNDTFDEIRELRQELRKARDQLAEMQEKHLTLLTDVQANTKAIIEAQTDADRGNAADALTRALNKAIEDDPFHHWMLDRRDTLPNEFREYVASRPLPFGYNPALHSDTITASVGHTCVAHLDDLREFMNYEIGKTCPDDEILAQKLLLAGCEPLPRRR